MAYTTAPTHKLDKVILQGLTVVSSTKRMPLGLEVNASTGERYKYVFLSTLMTPASRATYPAFAFENINQKETVTTVHDGDKGRSFVGVLCAVANGGGNYLWLQNRGMVPSCNVSTSVAAVGDTLACFEDGQLSSLPVEALSTTLAFDEMSVKMIGTAMEVASGGMADVQLHGV